MRNLLQPISQIKKDGSRKAKAVDNRNRDLIHNLPFNKKLKNPIPRYFVLAVTSFPILVSLLVVLTSWTFFLPSCQFQSLFGFPAPSCGLTRSFLLLFQGNLQESLKYHIFGPVLCVLAFAITITSSLELYWNRSFIGFYKRLFDYRVTLLFVLSFLTYYIFRLWIRYTFITLPFHLDQTSVWQALVEGAKAL